MTRPPTFRFLPDLPMPIRDALRGVASLADATEDALEPASKLLPEPLREPFHSALKSVEQAGKRLISAPIDMPQIATAARFMAGTDRGPAARRACTSVFVYAWEHLASEQGEAVLISETILADRLGHIAKAGDMSGADFAAQVVMDLRASSVIGRMPGLPRGASHPETDLHLLSVATWLLAARGDSIEDEEHLLDMTVALIRAMAGHAGDPFADPVDLSRFLTDTSAHL